METRVCAGQVLVRNGDGVHVSMVNANRQCRHVRLLDNNGSSQGNPIAWLVTIQIFRNNIRHEGAIFAVCCLPFSRARNDFHIISETAGQEH